MGPGPEQGRSSETGHRRGEKEHVEELHFRRVAKGSRVLYLKRRGARVGAIELDIGVRWKNEVCVGLCVEMMSRGVNT